MKHKDKLLDIREHLDNALHQAISIERIREETETAYELVDSLVKDEPQLNDNQKIVLEWLKEKTCKCNKPVYPMNLVRKAVEKMPVEIVNYYDHLSDREEFQVLAAFAQWGLEQEEKE
ncbi:MULTISPECIES: hypothetical protein [unclassified Enterococcus]|uniref:hypothetical protein n=1 Tax=unclassified Enterococcus TaxID=2608891 RepID=UPI0013EC671D|nr:MULTISPECIES: hypothetical protein [unclassified Enterococcus]